MNDERLLRAVIAVTLSVSSLTNEARADEQQDVQALRAMLEAERAVLEKQRRELDSQWQALRAQQQRLDALEAQLLSQVRGTGAPGAARTPDRGLAGAAAAPVQVAQSNNSAASPSRPVNQAPVERVGQAPAEADRPPEIAVIADEGGIITRAGQLTLEADLEYARADRNRVIFRGIGFVPSVLVGVFEINESRQDIVTGAAVVRYGLTNRFELNAKIPYIYRADESVLAPIADESGVDPNTFDPDFSADGHGIGDIELTARYQINSGRGGWPFLIANLQAIIPTGSDPFEVERTETGVATETATGSGFWGLAPSLTAILPSDPAVLFGTLGYTFNFAKDIDTRIGGNQIDRVDPGDSISATVGIGFGLNQRVSLSLGYAHTWTLGTETTLRPEITRPLPPVLGPPVTIKSRDLQLGRLLLGVTYRTSNVTSINWAVEIGATDDATDMRTVLRVPFVLGQ